MRPWWVLLPLAVALSLSARALLTPPRVAPPPATPSATSPSPSEAALAREAATVDPAAAPIEAAPTEATPIAATPIEPIEAVHPEARPSAVARVERVTRPAAVSGDAREPATRVEEPPITTPPAASLPVDSTPGRITVPLGVAVCFDHPCRDRSVAVFGPRSLMLPGGEHRVHYIEVEGPSEGPATTLGTTTVSVSAGVTTTIPRP